MSAFRLASLEGRYAVEWARDAIGLTVFLHLLCALSWLIPLARHVLASARLDQYTALILSLELLAGGLQLYAACWLSWEPAVER